ncbi:hypothetical protein AVEN_116104-1 [Araneus ventricosus]|uniref:Uncharacterized protein n=1 Tax=Araneus ventricosus TaxID=182803 RepID=A0A4Y2M8P9_ARAVE|nr:hypothetical protein AVEN_116104-1 [Araneus ventricosus]
MLIKQNKTHNGCQGKCVNLYHYPEIYDKRSSFMRRVTEHVGEFMFKFIGVEGNWRPSTNSIICCRHGPLKLDIHTKAVPIHLDVFLVDRFHFQPIKFGGSFTGRTVTTVNPSPTSNPIP